MGIPEQGSEEEGCHEEGGGPDRQVQGGLTVGRTGLVGLGAGQLTYHLFFSHKITSQDQWKPWSTSAVPI